MPARAGTEITGTVTADHVADADIVLIRRGGVRQRLVVQSQPPHRSRADFAVVVQPGERWIRVEVQRPFGPTLLLSNPIYLAGPEE